MTDKTWLLRFSTQANSLEEAVKKAKKVSFSLRDSYLPDDEEGFYRFGETHSPEEFSYGEPSVRVYDDGGEEVFWFCTSRCKTEFWWSARTKIVYVEVTTPDINDSSACRDFGAAGWLSEIHYIFESEEY